MSRTLDSIAAFCLTLCRIGSGVALAAMMTIVFAEIVSRNLFGVSLQLSEEIAGYLLVALAFLGFATSHHYGDLMRIEFLYDSLPETARRRLDLLIDLCALAAIAVLDIYAARFVMSSFQRETVAPTLLQTPLWIPQLAMPLGLTLFAVTLLCRILGRAVSPPDRR